MDYKLTKEKLPDLRLEERLMIYLYHSDSYKGRVIDIDDWYDNKKEDLFSLSTSFVHSSDITFYNILRWNELVEYGKPYGNSKKDGIDLPPGIIAVASIPNGKIISYSKLLKKLILNDILLGFIPLFRASKLYQGKTVPLLELWSEAIYRPKDIVAISLTSKGFKASKNIADKYDILMPWQLHEQIIRNRDFAEYFYNIKKS